MQHWHIIHQQSWHRIPQLQRPHALTYHPPTIPAQENTTATEAPRTDISSTNNPGTGEYHSYRGPMHWHIIHQQSRHRRIPQLQRPHALTYHPPTIPAQENTTVTEAPHTDISSTNNPGTGEYHSYRGPTHWHIIHQQSRHRRIPQLQRPHALTYHPPTILAQENTTATEAPHTDISSTNNPGTGEYHSYRGPTHWHIIHQQSRHRRIPQLQRPHTLTYHPPTILAQENTTATEAPCTDISSTNNPGTGEYHSYTGEYHRGPTHWHIIHQQSWHRRIPQLQRPHALTYHPPTIPAQENTTATEAPCTDISSTNNPGTGEYHSYRGPTHWHIIHQQFRHRRIPQLQRPHALTYHPPTILAQENTTATEAPHTDISSTNNPGTGEYHSYRGPTHWHIIHQQSWHRRIPQLQRPHALTYHPPTIPAQENTTVTEAPHTDISSTNNPGTGEYHSYRGPTHWHIIHQQD